MILVHIRCDQHNHKEGRREVGATGPEKDSSHHGRLYRRERTVSQCKWESPQASRESEETVSPGASREEAAPC